MFNYRKKSVKTGSPRGMGSEIWSGEVWMSRIPDSVILIPTSVCVSIHGFRCFLSIPVYFFVELRFFLLPQFNNSFFLVSLSPGMTFVMILPPTPPHPMVERKSPLWAAVCKVEGSMESGTNNPSRRFRDVLGGL